MKSRKKARIKEIEEYWVKLSPEKKMIQLEKAFIIINLAGFMIKTMKINKKKGDLL